MNEFTMAFTTKHRNELKVKKDCMLICDCITKFTWKYKYIYNGNDLIVFNVYDVDKEHMYKMLVSILGSLICGDDYQSLDLQSYIKK